MMDENKQAISFMNSYFALVDGLASGLENHLAENVVLDWFGRTIRGRQNVTAFMEAHKVNSRHMFSNIVPASGIGYKKKDSNRKKVFSRQTDKTIFEESNSSRGTEKMKDHNQNDIEAKGIGVMDDMSYNLSEGDLSNLFKLEITSTNIEEIEQSINRIKLEEEMAPTIKAIKRECGQGDGPVVVETSTVKYVEACGEIEFSRKFWKRDAWDAYCCATSNVHTWKRQCNLQIAYSVSTERQSSVEPRRNEKSVAPFGQPKGRLPSLEEINEISNRLIPNTNDFGGFLKSIDFFDDRRDFLESLQVEMAEKETNKSLLVPRYVRNKLVFVKPRVHLDEDDSDANDTKKFVFNYQIHLIIYEGSNKCRTNLLREFEAMKVFGWIYGMISYPLITVIIVQTRQLRDTARFDLPFYVGEKYLPRSCY